MFYSYFYKSTTMSHCHFKKLNVSVFFPEWWFHFCVSWALFEMYRFSLSVGRKPLFLSSKSPSQSNNFSQTCGDISRRAKSPAHAAHARSQTRATAHPSSTAYRMSIATYPACWPNSNQLFSDSQIRSAEALRPVINRPRKSDSKGFSINIASFRCQTCAGRAYSLGRGF